MVEAILTRDLGKAYGEKWALRSLNLSVPAGAVFGFLGPNGAGKTTTLKLLTGLRRPTTGEAYILGVNVRRELECRRLFGFLPESPSFYPWMSARDYLLFSGRLFGLGGRELRMRVEYLLDLVGLRKVRGPLRAFSRGMRQRLGVAQALINNPQLLLLDEPASSLDPIGRRELLDMIAALRGGLTVFFSTHILNELERVADRVAILNEGRLLVQASIEELRKKFSRRTITLVAGGEIIDLALRFRKENWVESVREEGGALRIKATSSSLAEINIPRILAEMAVPLHRMEVEDLSLEEIFVEILKNSHAGL